jgi:beta-glucosidase
MAKLQFPKGFLWGVATSAYQTEGDSMNTDWWEWEQRPESKHKSEKACDYWNKFREDHEFITQLGCNTFRLGLEWSKIEPKEGEFSDEAILHYRALLQDLKNKGIKTQVTLWWWASPLWFSQKYGFHEKKSVKIFVCYVEKIVTELGDLIDMYQVFNEPMVPLGQGYLAAEFPPGQTNPLNFLRAVRYVAKSYKKSYKIIKKKYPDSLVGITHLFNWYESQGSGFFVSIINRIAKWYRIDLLGNKIKKYQDYIGIDYYRLGRMYFDPLHSMYAGFSIEEDPKNVMGWITYPEGIYKVLKETYAKHKLPIYITENGLPTEAGLEDEERIAFIKKHLQYVHKAIEEGVDVRGYNHWSLMDNYEWLYGFKPKFGLIEIDFKTLERKPRKSFFEYAKICKSNEVEIG